MEAELAFINFDDLMTHIEEVICTMIDTVLENPEIAEHIRRLNPGFAPPKRPFLRMDYRDAIKYLQEHNITVPADEWVSPQSGWTGLIALTERPASLRGRIVTVTILLRQPREK